MMSSLRAATTVTFSLLVACVVQAAAPIEQEVSWKGGSELGTLAGRPVRLRFALNDADVYSFQFRD